MRESWREGGRKRESRMSEVKWTALGLFFILVFQQAHGKEFFLYHKFGDNVTLSCTNVLTSYSDCSSTTWNYNRDISGSIEVVGHGKFKGNLPPTRVPRLTLGPDCSLTVHNARAEDAGLYICQQWPSTGPKSGEDEFIHLSFLTVTPVSKPKPNGQLNLKCSLFTYDSTCKHSTLSWQDDKGKEIKTTKSKARCVHFLTVESNSSRVTCQLAVEERVVAFVNFTRVFSGTNSSSIETPNNKREVPNGETNILIAVVVATVAAAALLILIASLLFRRRKRERVNQTQSDDDIGVKPVGDADPTVKRPGPPTGQDQFDPDHGLTYALINHSSMNKVTRKGQAQDNDVDGGGVGDSVTYATVKTASACARGTEPETANIYTTVRKHQI